MLISYLNSYKKKTIVINFLIMALLSLMLHASYANDNNQDLKKAIMKLTLFDTVEVVNFRQKKFIISIADVKIISSNPIDRLNAMKEAKAISQANLSKVINGEQVFVKEKLKTIRIIKTNDGKSTIIHNPEIYEEFIKNKSRGVLNNIQYIQWSSDGIYYVATLIKI